MQEYRKINFGACADIFEIPGGRVLKAYRRTAYATKSVHDWEDHDLVTEAYFRAEALAYERLQSMAELMSYTPEYFGRADPIELLPIESVSEQFVKVCGLILEFIPGEAIKLNRLERTTRLKGTDLFFRMREKDSAAVVGIEPPTQGISVLSPTTAVRKRLLLDESGHKQA